MSRPKGWTALIVILLSCLAASSISSAQSFATLVSFDGTNGYSPYSVTLVQGRDASLYGTTESGGIYGKGNVFKLTRTGKLVTLYSFCAQSGCADGAYPVAGVIQAANGNFYGTTEAGGDVSCAFYGTCGTVFAMTPGGKLTSLYSFNNLPDGELPTAALVQANNGTFYGTTAQGGGPNCGTVLKMTASGSETILHAFDFYSDGQFPFAPLIQAWDGNLYGTTYTGGIGNGEGTAFKISPSGDFATLHIFDGGDGGGFYAGLVQGSDGDFYGVTLGGLFGDYAGTVFKMTSAGTVTTLHAFDVTDGAVPYASLIQATDGNFYGTTTGGGAFNYGTIFQISPAGIFTSLHSFDGADGSVAYGGLLQATDGNLYGTTVGGGGNDMGTIFRWTTKLSPFVAFVRPEGKIGQTGGILGQGFKGTTSVLLNGTPASFMVVSDTFLKATVPAGATTGYVTVTTPSGTLTSNVPFHVLP